MLQKKEDKIKYNLVLAIRTTQVFLTRIDEHIKKTKPNYHNRTHFINVAIEEKLRKDLKK